MQEHNSGSLGVVFAVASGARRVILLGMDCQRTGGATHWHGDHRAPLRNAVSMKNWPKSFDRARRLAERAGCQVVNATRETALTCFPRVDLGAELASLHRVANSVPAVKSEILIAPTSQIEKINI